VGTTRTFDEVRQAFIVEFQKLKTEQQSCAKLKDIKQVVGETAWEYDQRFWDLMSRLTYQIHDTQHKEWFIGGLLPLTWIPLMQQRWGSQREAFKQAMRIESMAGCA
jgi:hypothetical protein